MTLLESEDSGKGLLSTMKNRVAALPVVILLIIEGVLGEGWNADYEQAKVCIFVRNDVVLYCSLTYPRGLTIEEVYWTKENSKNPPNILLDPNYSNRASVVRVDVADYRPATERHKLTIKKATSSHAGTYYCVVTHSKGQKWIGPRGVYLDVKDAPQASVFISPPGDILEGTDVSLTCTSKPDLLVNWCFWYKKKEPSANEESLEIQGNIYTIKHISPEDSARYYCVMDPADCGYLQSSPVYLQVFYPPKNTTVLFSGPVGFVTLTCSSDANPPVESYTWFKVNEPTPVGSGQRYSITNIRPEDGGQYYCEARNRHGANTSPAVSVPKGEQSPILAAVLIFSLCGVVLCCVVFRLRHYMKVQNENTNTNQPHVIYQNLNPNTTQPNAVYQSLNPNTTQPDAVYQSLNPNTTQPEPVYQSLNPNNTQPDAVYQSLNPNTTQPDAVYQSLNPNTIQPDAVYQSLNPNNTQPEQVYQSLNPNTTEPDAFYQSLNPNTTQPDAVYQSLNPNTTQPDAVYQSLNPNTTQPGAVYQSLNPNTTQPDAVY